MAAPTFRQVMKEPGVPKERRDASYFEPRLFASTARHEFFPLDTAAQPHADGGVLVPTDVDVERFHAMLVTRLGNLRRFAAAPPDPWLRLGDAACLLAYAADLGWYARRRGRSTLAL